VLSADGTKLAFVSEARNFGLPDTNGASDVFVRDLATGQITLVSVNRLGTNSGNGMSDNPIISADGTKVAFTSYATNLQAVPVTGDRHIYVRDLVAGTTTLASVDASGATGGQGYSGIGAGFDFSADGTKVAFVSDRGLVPHQGSPAIIALHLRDLVAGTTTLVSIDHTGTRYANGPTFDPTFSPDGSALAFTSLASDLVAGGRPGSLYVRDLVAGTASSVTPGASDIAEGVGFSAHGTRLVFATPAGLGPADTNGRADVYVHDRVAGTTALVSVRQDGADSGNAGSVDPVISPDGGQVAFTSDASDLVGGDCNEERDVFVRDLAGGATTLVSARGDGTDSGDEASTTGSFAADRVAYQSRATDLAANDANATWDIYLATPYEEPPPPSTSTTRPVPPTTRPIPTTTELPTTTDPPPTTDTTDLPPTTELPPAG